MSRAARALAPLLALALAPGATATAKDAADPRALAELDGYVRGLADAGGFSGVVLVARDGEVLLERAHGRRDPMKEGAPAPDTRFNLASAGKMFTAVAVLQQVAAGRLTLDTPVGAVLTDYPDATFAREVTIRHLLTHTAGAGDIDLFGVEHAGNRERARSVAGMLALHADRPPGFAPGSELSYGNFGHVVLGRIVEVLSGEPFEAYLQAHVFAPAGMARTGFVDCAGDAADLAVGYARVDGAQVRNCATLPRRGFPAGGQVSTARDLLRFVEALRAGTLLPLPLLEEALRPQREFMGLGFFATEYGPGHAARDFRWGHAGSADGICTDVRTYPATGETIIVLSNSEAPACFEVSGFLHRQWNAAHD